MTMFSTSRPPSATLPWHLQAQIFLSSKSGTSADSLEPAPCLKTFQQEAYLNKQAKEKNYIAVFLDRSLKND